MTAAAPAAQTAAADPCEDIALSATHGLIAAVGAEVAAPEVAKAVVAPAAVELKHNAQPNTAPRICLEGFEESIEATFLNAEGKLDSERAYAKPHVVNAKSPAKLHIKKRPAEAGPSTSG